MSALTTDEIEQLRFHLGYGNLQVGAYPWTPDGFFELFTNVIQPYLSDGLSTTATTAIDASAGPVIVSVTPGEMTTTITYGQGSVTSAIVVGARLYVDCDDDAEIVVVKSVTGSSFTAKFKYSHDVTGYPVAVQSGTSTLRYLIHRADRVHEDLFGPLTQATAGLLSVDKGEVVYTGQDARVKGLATQYDAIIKRLSSLIRVQELGDGFEAGPATQLEAY